MIFDYLINNWMEVLGLITGLLCVWLLIRENVLTFPIGLIYAVLTVVVVYNEKLYADVFLNVYYVGMNAYGWFFWLRGGGDRRIESRLQVGSVTQKQIVWLTSILVIGSAVMGYALTSYTDADLAYPDSFTTVASFIAMYMSAKKFLESWYLWFIVDVIQVILYLIKGIELYALLYFIYLVMAFFGWKAWKTSAREVLVER